MSTRQWFQNDDFDSSLPEALSEECARVYGRDRVGVEFAQALAAFLDIPQSRAILEDAIHVHCGKERL